MKSKTTLALLIITTSLSAKGKVHYDDYHNIDTGIVGETQGIFKVKGKTGKSTLPIIEFTLRYQSQNNKCQLRVTDYSNIDNKGRAKSSFHFIESYTVKGDDRSCDAYLGAEFSSCYSNQVLSSNGQASVRLKPVWDEITQKHLFNWTISLYRQKKYHEGLISVMCNK